MFEKEVPIFVSGTLLEDWIYVVGAMEGEHLHGMMYTGAVQD